MQLSIWVDW